MKQPFILIGIVLSLSLTAAAQVSDSTEASRLKSLERTLSRIMSKAGIQFSGEFRSQYLHSALDGAAVNTNRRRDEDVEYTSVDFDITARPNSLLQAHVIFRLHQDWRNFFSSMANPIFSRWISINGSWNDVFSYDIGNFRQKYTGLTMWSPDVDIPFEPEIFARQRELAQGESFLGNNDRLLQGVNFNFDAQISPILREAHLNAFAARLAIAHNETVQAANVLEDRKMDKYVWGSNLQAVILPDLYLGGTFLNIFDAMRTYGGPEQDAKLLRQNTKVAAGRLGAGTAAFLDPKRFNLRLSGEAAFSIDDSAYLSADTLLPEAKIETVNGTAITADLKAEIGLGTTGSIEIGAGYSMTNETYRNDMSQSPTFLASRIMNTENDLDGSFYSTFDALYRHVFNFTPSENATTGGWYKAPMHKLAYTNALFTRSERDSLKSDPALFLVNPYGPATPNRQGLKANAGISLLNKAIYASARLQSVSEITGRTVANLTDSLPSAELPASDFLEISAGLSANIAALGAWWRYPLVLSGSFTQSQMSNDGHANAPGSTLSTTVNFINAGLYWTFWERASLLGGWQSIITDSDDLFTNDLTTFTQQHWAVGLEFKVSEGGVLTGSFGKTSLSTTDSTLGSSMGNTLDQWQTDLYLTVKF